MSARMIIAMLVALLVPLSSCAQDVNAQLIEAAKDGQTDKVRELLHDSTQESKDTALVWAAGRGHSMAAKALLDGDANPNVKSADKENGWTALTIASAYGHYTAVQTLLNGGADVNLAREGDDMTPFILAVSHSHFPPFVHPGARHKEIVQALLEAGADVNAQTQEGDSVLHLAKASMPDTDGGRRVIDMLMAAGGRVLGAVGDLLRSSGERLPAAGVPLAGAGAGGGGGERRDRAAVRGDAQDVHRGRAAGGAAGFGTGAPADRERARDGHGAGGGSRAGGPHGVRCAGAHRARGTQRSDPAGAGAAAAGGLLDAAAPLPAADELLDEGVHPAGTAPAREGAADADGAHGGAGGGGGGFRGPVLFFAALQAAGRGGTQRVPGAADPAERGLVPLCSVP